MTPKTTTYISLTDDGHGNVLVATSASPPVAGAHTTPAQALALEMLTICARRHVAVCHGPRHIPALALAMDIVSPEGYGWAATSGARDHARDVLGMSRVPGTSRVLVDNEGAIS